MLPEWRDLLRAGSWLMFDASWRAVLVAVGVAMVLGAARARSGGVRHAAWSAVLIAMVLMPVLPRLAPAIPIAVPGTWATPDVSPLPQSSPPVDSLPVTRS